MRLVGGMVMKNRLATHPTMMVKNQEGYLDCRSSPLRNEGPQIHTGLSSSEHQCQEAVEMSLAMKVSGGSVQVKQRANVDLDVHLKGLHTDSPLTNTHPKLQQRDSILPSARNIQRRIELSCFRAWAGEVALSQIEWWQVPLFFC